MLHLLLSTISGVATLATTTILLTLILGLVGYFAYQYAGPPLHKQMRVFREMGVPFIPPLQARREWESAVMMGKKTMVQFDTDQVEKYGKVFGRYDLNQPSLMISDFELLRDIFVKEFNSFYNRREAPDGSPEILKRALSFERGKRWREILALVTPAFSSANLRYMDDFIWKCLQVLQQDLENRFAKAVADKIDEKENVVVEVDARDYFGPFALDVIGTEFFGVDVGAITEGENLFVKHAKAIFKPPSMLRILLYLMVPIKAVKNYLVEKGVVGLPPDARNYFEKSIPH